MTHEDMGDVPDVVASTLQLDTMQVYVLIDPRVSHSFVAYRIPYPPLRIPKAFFDYLCNFFCLSWAFFILFLITFTLSVVNCTISSPKSFISPTSSQQIEVRHFLSYNASYGAIPIVA